LLDGIKKFSVSIADFHSTEIIYSEFTNLGENLSRIVLGFVQTVGLQSMFIRLVVVDSVQNEIPNR
jgi:hypothetical protein